MQVASPEILFDLHGPLYGTEFAFPKQNRINQLRESKSSPFIYGLTSPTSTASPASSLTSNAASIRVPPISFHHHVQDEETTSVLFPTLATFPQVPLDEPVKLLILGGKQVGKSALALRYLTKNQTCDSTYSGKPNRRMRNDIRSLNTWLSSSLDLKMKEICVVFTLAEQASSFKRMTNRLMDKCRHAQ